MKLIDSIEIAYFRSIYKQKLDDLMGTNILFGRNDAGKSNVLRALNLFFNNQTNPGQAFDFEKDFCHIRLSEADVPDRDVRKFVYVKLWFNTPPNWRNSLGESFWVKKQWSITRQDDPIEDNSISDTTKHQYLTRFLKKVRFYYIPAIKDRRIFEHLLGEIYKIISDQEQFRESLQTFTDNLRSRTFDLSRDLWERLQLKSAISPPTDLTDLFKSLDFETEGEHGDSYSLTLQRGDGIQVRHIPAILAFLAKQSQEDFHLWGFEEPENSLELANAIAEAEEFTLYGQQKNKQIFLTSHSPAFFSLEKDNVARFFVSQSDRHDERFASKLVPISADSDEMPSELMGETPHLPVISNYLRDADRRIRKLEEQQDRLAQELAEHDRSLVFLEGESDCTIFQASWQSLFNEKPPVKFVPAEGTSKMASLAKDGQVLNHLAPNRNIFVVVDNDYEGRQLRRTSRLEPGGKWDQHNSNGTYWCRLPFAHGFQEFMNNLEIAESHWPGCLENFFTTELRSSACDAGVYAVDSPYEILLNEAYKKVEPYVQDQSNRERLYVFKISPEKKLDFASWVAKRIRSEPQIVDPLRQMLEKIRQIEQDSDPH